MAQNPDIVLHWYTSSPFAQKVLWALLYKNVDFKTVSISPVEPRPLRRPLDGGYRKTPILQIGNHSYCDSKAIFAELERRFPEPSFYPADAHGGPTESLAVGFGRWTDNTLFTSITSQLPFDFLDDAFLKDRSEFAGRPIKKDFIKFAAPFLKQPLVSEFQLVQSFVKERSKNNTLFALGTDKLSLVDLHIAMLTWFAKMLAGSDFVSKEIPELGTHLKKVLKTVQYEKVEKLVEIDAEEALQIAKNQSWTLEKPAHDGSLKVKLGSVVTVTPTDTGVVPVFGTLISSTVNETVIEITDDDTGITSFVHFPVLGFLVLPMGNDSKL